MINSNLLAVVESTLTDTASGNWAKASGDVCLQYLSVASYQSQNLVSPRRAENAFALPLSVQQC